jgi:flagellar biosynthesis/type III secretory pathway M-ring protein FliF/YscJ
MILLSSDSIGGISPPPGLDPNNGYKGSLGAIIVFGIILLIVIIAIIVSVVKKRKQQIAEEQETATPNTEEKKEEVKEETKEIKSELSEEGLSLLKKYKQLLDNDLITKEEYDAKLNAVIEDKQ